MSSTDLVQGGRDQAADESAAISGDGQDFVDVDVAKLPSQGSKHHATKSCLPCLFFVMNQCLKDKRCNYCHIYHEEVKPKRIRPSKKTRLQLRLRGGAEQ